MSFVFLGKYSVVCHLPHDDINTRHFHCPVCCKLIKKKENMITHLKRCQGLKENTSKNTNVSNRTENIVFYDRDESEENTSKTTFNDQPVEKTSLSSKKTKCKECGKIVNKKWLRRHSKIHEIKINEINQNRHHHTVLIDEKMGIFCSAINLSGPTVPVHVVKRTVGSNQETFCENQHCIDAKETARRGNNQSYECSHIKSVAYACRGIDIFLRDESLRQLREGNFITQARYEEMILYKDNAISTGSSLLVKIPPMPNASTRYVYLSIATDMQRYWSKVGRTIVTFDSVQNSFSCRCSTAKRYCSHKAIAKWFIFQEMPQFFLTLNDEGSEEKLDETANLDQSELKKSDFKEGSRQNEMVEYMKSTKKIPSVLPIDMETLYDSREFLDMKEILPKETTCHRCNGSLAVQKTNNRAKIITMTKVIRGEMYTNVFF